jgi:hypothetical protein
VDAAVLFAMVAEAFARGVVLEEAPSPVLK